jgi:hypothetical protein
VNDEVIEDEMGREYSMHEQEMEWVLGGKPEGKGTLEKPCHRW